MSLPSRVLILIFGIFLGVPVFSVTGDQEKLIENLVRNIIQSQDPLKKEKSIRALQEIQNEESTKALLLLLTDPEDRLVRFLATLYFGKIGDQDKVKEVLIPMAMESQGDSRNFSLLALGIKDDTEMTADSYDNLGSKNWKNRWSSAYTFGILKDHRAIPRLESMARRDRYRDGNGRFPVRMIAEKSLQEIRNSVQWFHSFEKARELSRILGKPLLIYLYSNGGEMSSSFEKEVLENREFVKISRRFACLRWNIYREKGNERLEDLEITGTPSLVILTSWGHPVLRVPGVVPLSDLQNALKRVLHIESEKGQILGLWQEAFVALDRNEPKEAFSGLETLKRYSLDHSTIQNDLSFLLGVAYGKMEMYEKSIQEMENYIQSNPFSPFRDEVHYYLGFTYLLMEEMDSSKRNFEKLLITHPDSPFATTVKALFPLFEASRA